GLGKYSETFAANDVDFRVLPDLNSADLQELGVSLGHRKEVQKVESGRYLSSMTDSFICSRHSSRRLSRRRRTANDSTAALGGMPSIGLTAVTSPLIRRPLMRAKPAGCAHDIVSLVWESNRSVYCCFIAGAKALFMGQLPGCRRRLVDG